MNRSTARIILATMFIILFLLAAKARPETYIVQDDPCVILRAEQTAGGSWLEWCDLDGDKRPEIVQEVIRGRDGTWYYLNILSVDSERLGAYQGRN